MNVITTKAFVMKSFPWKERHKLLHLLTPELGLITALAPASERMKSDIRGATQLFSLSEFVLTEKQGRYSVRSAFVIESFVPFYNDFERLTAVSHASEVFTDVARHDEPNRTLFDLWAYSVYEISVSEYPVFIARMATLRPVSYTHLDVYKRQETTSGNKIAINNAMTVRGVEYRSSEA